MKWWGINLLIPIIQDIKTLLIWIAFFQAFSARSEQRSLLGDSTLVLDLIDGLFEFKNISDIVVDIPTAAVTPFYD